MSGHASLDDDCRAHVHVAITRLVQIGEPCVHVIGDGIDIGTGAKVPGRTLMGTNVLIGTNAVVANDVPSNGIVVGVLTTIRARGPQ